jgi:hypothetical protein
MFSFRENVFSGKNAISKNVEEKYVTCRKQDVSQLLLISGYFSPKFCTIMQKRGSLLLIHQKNMELYVNVDK